MTKARDLANAGTALTSVSATELGYVDGVTSAIQTQIDSKEPTLPSQTGNSGKYLTTDGTNKSWGTVSQYSLPSQTGNSGKFLTTNGTSESWGTVNQPITWTARFAQQYTLYRIAYNGSLYVAVGSNGSLYTSTNATSWTSRTSGFGTNSIYSVTWFANASLWVAVGSNGTITTSPDGITWTARTANMATNDINDVLAVGNTVVAIGTGGGTTNTGGITYSTDGITWTRKSQSLTVGTSYNAITHNGTNWLIVANLSTNNFLYASTPSGTWTVGSIGGATMQVAFFDGTRTYAIRQSGVPYYTTSSTFASWTSLSNNIAANGSGNTYPYLSSYYNGRLYYVNPLGSTGNNPYGIADFSTTPSSTYANLSSDEAVTTLAPLPASQPHVIWVGAIGRLLATSGYIYSSF